MTREKAIKIINDIGKIIKDGNNIEEKINEYVKKNNLEKYNFKYDKENNKLEYSEELDEIILKGKKWN